MLKIFFCTWTLQVWRYFCKETLNDLSQTAGYLFVFVTQVLKRFFGVRHAETLRGGKHIKSEFTDLCVL